MKNLKIMSKIALLIGAVSIVFTVLSAIAQYEQVTISESLSGQTAPADLFAINILFTILPYLFVAVLSLAVGLMLRRSEKENVEKETVPQPQTQPTEQ